MHQVDLRDPSERRFVAAMVKTAGEAVRILNTPVPIPDVVKAAQRRASIIFGEGAQRMSSADFVENHLGVGYPFPILCPRCGGSTRRVHRTPVDRLLSVVVTVWRYRCLDTSCGWEDPVRMKPHHFYRIH